MHQPNEQKISQWFLIESAIGCSVQARPSTIVLLVLTRQNNMKAGLKRVVKKAAEQFQKFIQPNNISKAHGQWSETLQSVVEMVIAEWSETLQSIAEKQYSCKNRTPEPSASIRSKGNFKRKRGSVGLSQSDDVEVVFPRFVFGQSHAA